MLPKNVTLIIPNGPLSLGENCYGWFPLTKEYLTKGTVILENNDIRSIIMSNYGCEKVDAVIAFSQGCLAAAVLLKYGIIESPKLIAFSHISPPISFPEEFWLEVDLTKIKTLVYVGKEDNLVSPAHSKKFSELFDGAVIEHRWGHVIPSTSEYKIQYDKFLND